MAGDRTYPRPVSSAPVTTRGFLYAAAGEAAVGEAVASVARLRTVHDDVPAAIVTDLPALAATGRFDEVVELPRRDWVGSTVRMWAAGRSPFERTVQLDADMHVCADVSDLFSVLDRFDLAAVPVAIDDADRSDAPAAFRDVDPGVLAYRRNDRTTELFADVMNGRTLRAALWRSDCRVVWLRPEFNMRADRYRSSPVVAAGPVRIIRGRAAEVDALAARWNASSEPRLLTPLRYQARLFARFARGTR